MALTLVAGSPAAAGKGGETQPSGMKTYRVLIVMPVMHPSLDSAIEGFKDGLASHGLASLRVTYVELEAAAQTQGIGQIVTSELASGVDLVLALTSRAAQEAVEVTSRAGVPLVYTAVTDPVASGIVTSMAASELHSTGVSDRYPVPEQVAFFDKFLHAGASIAVMFSPDEVNSRILSSKTREELIARGHEVVLVEVADDSEIAEKAKAAAAGHDAVVINGDNRLVNHLDVVVRHCKADGTPLFVGDPESAEHGAVAAVGPSYYDLGVDAASKAARILLKGEAAGDIPSSTPRVLRYVVNQAAARQMGGSIPAEVWQSRDIWESVSARSKP